LSVLHNSDKGWSSSLGVRHRVTNPHHNKPACYEMLHRAQELTGSCKHGNELLYSMVGNFLTSSERLLAS